MICTIGSFWSAVIGLFLGVAFGWFISALMSAGKDQDDIIDDHQARNN